MSKDRRAGWRRGLVACLGVFALFGVNAVQAGYTVRISQVGPNVVATGSGSLNVQGMDAGESAPDGPAMVRASTGLLFLGGGPGAGHFVPLIGPSGFGVANDLAIIQADSRTGNWVGIAGGGAGLGVPLNYSWGAQLGTSTATWNNTTIAALNLAPGTYVWNLGSQADADRFVLVIDGAATVPTLSEWGILITSLLLAAWAALRFAGRRL